jgi:hypothetical protein
VVTLAVDDSIRSKTGKPKKTLVKRPTDKKNVGQPIN